MRGAGANTWFLAREGFDVYAFDGSKSAIGRVKTLLSKDNLTANLKVCDAIEMDYPNDYFDFAIDNFSICCNKMDCIGCSGCLRKYGTGMLCLKESC